MLQHLSSMSWFCSNAVKGLEHQQSMGVESPVVPWQCCAASICMVCASGTCAGAQGHPHGPILGALSHLCQRCQSSGTVSSKYP